MLIFNQIKNSDLMQHAAFSGYTKLSRLSLFVVSCIAQLYLVRIKLSVKIETLIFHLLPSFLTNALENFQLIETCSHTIAILGPK